MFGKKRIQELETLLMEIQSNSENNYKDAAKEAYQQFWNVLEIKQKANQISAKTYAYYEKEGRKWQGKMQNYHHQNNVKSF